MGVIRVPFVGRASILVTPFGTPRVDIRVTYGEGLLSVKQPFYILVCGLDQESATKWLYNWFTGLILGEFCTIFGA